MTRPAGAAGYRAVLRTPGVPHAFAAATLGRLSYATLSLSLLLTVQHATGSFAAAGSSLGAYAVASIAMPVKSRLVDRFGQRRVLPLLAAVFAAVLLAVASSALAGITAAAVYATWAAGAGLVAPPLGPSMRALWAALTPDPAARQRAYSLDGVVEETLYALGPLVVGAVLVISSGVAALVLTAALNLLGTVGMAASPAAARHAAPVTTPPTSRLIGPFQKRGFALLIFAMLGIGLGGGPLEVAVVARTQDAGHSAVAGYLLAALSVGSAVGGLAWGHLTHSRRTSTQLGALVSVMAVGGVAAGLAPNLALLALALLLTGVVEAPALIVAYLAADNLVPEGGRTEATSWVSTSNNVGVALGTAFAGVIIDRASAGSALIAGAAVLGVTALLVFSTRGRLDVCSRTPAAEEPATA